MAEAEAEQPGLAAGMEEEKVAVKEEVVKAEETVASRVVLVGAVA